MNVRTGAPMVPMSGMPPNPMMPRQPMNMLPPPMPVPPIVPPQAAGTAPVAPIMRSNAGRRKRFGDSLEGMLATTRPLPVASDQMAGMNVFTGQMPRRQMMGGTAVQPPVRRMMGGGSVPVPRETDIYGQDHMLAYIRPDEADLLMGLGGAGTPGPGGIPQFGFFDFISDVFSGKSSNTGGRNEPRGTSSSSPSYASPSNDPYAEDRGGSSSRATNILDTPSQSSADAGRQYAESMIAGGGGTNLSGSGSTAMEKLVAAQQAQTQKDDGPPPDVTASSYTPGSIIASYENREVDPAVQKARDVAAQKLQEYLDNQKSQAAQEDSFTQPNTQVNTGVVGGYDTLGIGSSDDPLYTPPSSITIDDTPPSDITGSFSSPGDLNFLDPSVLYYDIDGVPHNTSAEQQAANRLINERKAREQEEQRIAQAAADEAARTQAEAAAREQRLRDERTAAASSGMNPLTAYGGMSYPESEDAFLGVGPIDLTDPRGDEANVMTNYLTDPITDPINTGLGGASLDKAVTDATEDTDDRNFIQKFIDDIKDVPGNILNDLQMGIAAGFYGNDYGKARANLEKVLNADGTRKYSDKQIDDWIAATKDTKKNQKDQRERDSARDDDDGPTSVVDPCPEGFKLDPASGICVPVEDTGGDDTDEDSGDDKEEDTSDDELSGVVVTPPPPTSYLDNPISIGRDRPIMMNRGGSVGLNRAADNFLAAMGA